MVSEVAHAGTPVWGPEQTLSGAGVDAAHSQVASDDNGRSLAVWVEGGDVRYRYYDGAQWNGPALVESAPEVAGYPRVAFASDDTALIIWSQGSTTAPDTPHLFARWFDAAVGQWIGSAQQLENGGWSVRDNSARLSVNSSGEAVVAWHRWTGEAFAVFAAMYTPGGGWSSANEVAADTGSNGMPEVALADNGEAMAVWRDSRDADRVLAARFAGGQWQAPRLLIEQDSQDQLNVSMDANGNAVVVGIGNIQGQSADRIYAVHYDRGVDQWSSDSAQISILESTPRWDSDNQIHHSADGSALAIWRNNMDELYSRRYVPGLGWDSNATLIANDGLWDAVDTRLSVNADGDAALAWERNNDIAVAVYDAATGTWSGQQIIDGGSGGAGDARVHLSDTGRITVVWLQNDGTNQRVMSRYAVDTDTVIDFDTPPVPDGALGEFQGLQLDAGPAAWCGGGPYSADPTRNIYFCDSVSSLPIVFNNGLDSLQSMDFYATAQVTLNVSAGGQSLISDASFTSGEVIRFEIDATSLASDTLVIESSCGSCLGLTRIEYNNAPPQASPELSITAPAPGGYLNTARPTISLSYTSDNPIDTDSIELSIDGSPIAADCTADQNGAQCTPQSPIGEGQATLSATVADTQGNVSDPAQVSFAIDTVAPLVSIDDPAENLRTANPNLTISGSVSEAPDSLTLEHGGNLTSLGTTATFSTTVTLTEGANPLTVSAADAAGNLGRASRTPVLDTAAPDAPDDTLIAVSIPDDNGQVTVTGYAGSVEPGASVTVTNLRTGETVTVTANADGSFSASIAAQAGDELDIQVTDPAGNASPTGHATVRPAVRDAPDPQPPGAFKTARRYSPGGRLLGEIRPRPAPDQGYPAVRYTYNARGLRVNTEHGVLSQWHDQHVPPREWTGFQVSHQNRVGYDSHGRKIHEGRADAGGQMKTLTQYSYDEHSRRHCQAVRLNPSAAPASACTPGAGGAHGPDRITRYEYNAHDNLMREYRAVGTALEQIHVQYTYTDEQQIQTVTDANGHTAEFRYDGYGRKTRWCFPDEQTGQPDCSGDFEAYAYDANGNRTALTKRDGRSIHYSYDKLNRKTKKDIPATSAGDVYYGYTLDDLQVYARFGAPDGAGVSTQYTGFGEIVSETSDVLGPARTVEHRYDRHGNRTELIHPDGQSFRYRRDGAEQLSAIHDPQGDVLTAYAYDPFNRPERRTTAGGASTALGYDPLSRIDHIDYQFAGSAEDLSLDFSYNPAGQLTRQSLSNTAYHHDESEPTGRRGAYTVNAQNEYTAVNGESYAYDANGNLIEAGRTDYGYDVENRLISVSSATVSATLEYDPKGRLVQLTVEGQTTEFLYEGDALIGEYKDGLLAKRYVHGTGVDVPLVQYNGEGIGEDNRRFLHANHQGSIIAMSDNDGAVGSDWINTYDEYGVPANANQGRFGYTGQMYLKGLGLYHYRARVYNPRIGRFHQVDPIGYEDQINLYAYVGNDPLNNNDPTGKQTADVNLGMLLGLILSGDSPEEAGKKMAKVNKKMASGSMEIVSMARGGILVDLVDVAIQVSNGESVQDDVAGMGLEEVVGAVVEQSMKKKLGADAAEGVSKVVGKAAGAATEEAVDRGVFETDPDANTLEPQGGQSSSSSNSYNGMSAGGVKICSGMGAQQERC